MTTTEIGEKQNALEKIIDWFISANPATVLEYVDKLRFQNPGIIGNFAIKYYKE